MDQLLADLRALRAVPLDNAVPPALRYVPPGEPAPARPAAAAQPAELAAAPRPAQTADIAFAPLTELAAWLRSRAISAVELARMYLDRLRRFDPQLQCVITLTEELALRQAERADADIAAGRWRGPLHGVPWGCKDLLAVRGYKTTWGAGPYREQVRGEQATVATRLEDAGAVLLAKTSVGELAWGEHWFGGMTANPWKLDEGSSGSSAGSAAASAAGLVGFAIGTETWGSIVSPCTRCGVTGLRPTFGGVPRSGAMALSWSMDKIGPIARSADDCALIFDAVRGADGLDPSAVDAPFAWPPARDPRALRIGVAQRLFDADYAAGENDEGEQRRLREWQEIDRRALQALRDAGLRLETVEVTFSVPVAPLGLILTAEAAAAFDELTRSGRDRLLKRQVADAWPTTFRQGQLIPAVEYVRANRIRTLLVAEMEKLMSGLDALVIPTYGGDLLLATNLTGHPAVVFPDGLRADGTPVSLTVLGRLHGEAEVLSIARAFQRATDFHTRRPPAFN